MTHTTQSTDFGFLSGDEQMPDGDTLQPFDQSDRVMLLPSLILSSVLVAMLYLAFWLTSGSGL